MVECIAFCFYEFDGGRGSMKSSIAPLTACVRNRIHGRTMGSDKGGVGENQGVASSPNFAATLICSAVTLFEVRGV